MQWWIHSLPDSPSPSISEEEHDMLNSIKPKLLDALVNNTHLSRLHKQLDDKSKYIRFNDLISYHPMTSAHYSIKEKVACLVTEWNNEYLHIAQLYDKLDDGHKRNYPLIVLLPVVLEYMCNSEVIEIESENEDLHIISIVPKKSNPDSVIDEFERLCANWQGEYDGILHLNTCSVDNIISNLSLYREKILIAREFAGNSENSHIAYFSHSCKIYTSTSCEILLFNTLIFQ